MSNFISTFYLLMLISLGYFVTDIYLPSLPAISTSLNSSEIAAQSTMFSYLLAFSFAPLFFGPLSDRLGRKIVISRGILICIAGTIGCYFAQSIYTLIAMRALQGVGAGAVLIASRAMIPDLFQGKVMAKQLSYLTMFMPFVLAVAPTIGGILQDYYGWRSVFLFLFFYLVCIFLLIQPMHETLKTHQKRSLKEACDIFISLIKHKSFILYGLGVVFPSIGIFAYLTASPFLFQEVLGLTASEYGRLSLYIGMVVLCTGTLNARLVKVVSIDKLIATGSILMALSGCLLLIVHFTDTLNTWTLLLPSMLFFSCIPLCISNAFAKSMNQIDSHFGSANALLTFTQFLSGSIGSFIFSLIKEKNALAIGVCLLLIGVFSIINSFFAAKMDKGIAL